MYRKPPANQLAFEDFVLPFGGKLNGQNRWVRLAELIPWDEVEAIYAKHFSHTEGAPAKSARVAFGALLIKERLGLSDEETVEQIRENPYLQYFLGFHEFRDERPFNPSMFVHFRKRFSLDDLNHLNEEIVQRSLSTKHDDDNDDDAGDGNTDSTPPGGGGESETALSSKPNRGKLLMDATCAPADIRYPTDIDLLNQGREKTEEIIDTLFVPLKGQQRKPRTYRRKARREYVAFIKSGKRKGKRRRKALRQQLNYLRRNLSTIDALSEQVPLTVLSRRQYRELLVIRELYRQQQWMYDHRSRRIADRIVSISQPHVRPIVRGKAATPTEFGSKLSVSQVDGFAFVDRLEWDPYNESTDLIAQVEAYRRRFGHYPESVHCDRLYRTRDNRAYCQARGIRLSGPPLGRPPKPTADNAAELREQARQRHQDEVDRIPIEGKFGQGKRRFGLGRIMAKLRHTSEVSIAIIFIVMNLEKCLREIFLALLTVLGICRKGISGTEMALKGLLRTSVVTLQGAFGTTGHRQTGWRLCG